MVALLLTSFAEARAVAQEPSAPAQVREAALARAKQGWMHYRADRYEEALKAFREAEAKVHAPTFLIMVARSCRQLGRLVEARSVYQIIVDDKLGANAPPAFLRAQEEAKAELDAVAQRIPTVEISVIGAAPGTERVMLDGLSIALSTAVERDPGTHTLVAGSPGHPWLTRDITLEEGARKRLAVDLVAGEVRDVREPAADETAQQLGEGAAADAALGGTQPSSGRSTAIVVGGVAATAAGVGVGIVFALASNAKSAAQEQLLPPTCGEPARCPGLDLNEYNRLGHAKVELANASVWSFAAAGVLGLGTMAYVMLTRKPGSPEPTATSVSVAVVPGGLVLSTRW
jgi:hypothetical protein